MTRKPSEIDDALSCESLPDGSLRVRVHIALVADFVAKDGAMDREAAQRATTGLSAGDNSADVPRSRSRAGGQSHRWRVRPVLTTDVTYRA